MKKKYLFLYAIVLAFVSSFAVQAQTDVTATHLQNADFNVPPYCYTVAGGAVLTEGVERIGTTGWIFMIPGWTNASIINNNAVQVATGQYGTITNSQGFNGIPVPATDKNGNSTGAALSMSAGWGDRAMYQQEVTLTSGKYTLKVDVWNGNTALNAAANYTGFIPATGNPYFSTRLNYPQNTWVTDSVSFFLTETTTGFINLGYTTSSGGSANGPKFFLDNVKLIAYGIDKSGIKMLIDSANVLLNNREDVGESTVYEDLADEVAVAQSLYDDVNASAGDVVSQENYLKEAIANVHGAILLQKRVLSWVTFPYNATEAIKNPSFEEALTVGWEIVGTFQRQTNTSFDPFKVGTYYAERWISGGGSLTNLRLAQTVKNIPNGVYLLTVSAHAMQQLNTSFPGGAFVFANEATTEVFERKDYSVTAQVTENILEIGFEVAESGNWVAIDNFRLSYVSDGSPYIVFKPDTLSFSPVATQKIVNISGGNLTGDVTLTATSSFTLSKSTLTAAEVMSAEGVNVTVTSIATAAIAADSLVATHGDVSRKLPLRVSESLSASNAGLFFDQSLSELNTFEVKGDVFASVTVQAPQGIMLSESSISRANAAEGASVVVIWNGTTNIENQYIYINSGTVRDSVLIFAVANNLISGWDGDDMEGEGTRLTDFGWSLTEKDGITPVAGSFNNYAATSGIRLVPITNQNYMYRGKPWKGHRVAYLRTWGNPATNVYNLSVALEADKHYTFRGVSTWHDNESNPTFTYAVNTAPANTGDTLGIQSRAFTVKRVGADYEFSFVPTTTGTHYLTVSSTVVNDVMATPFYLAIYESDKPTATQQISDLDVKVYPTLTNGPVVIETAGKTGMARIYNLSGSLVGTQVLNGGNTTVELPTEGVYFLHLTVENAVRTVKVIRTR